MQSSLPGDPTRTAGTPPPSCDPEIPRVDRGDATAEDAPPLSSIAHEAQARLAAIIETSDDAIVSKTLDGIIRSWNPGAERLFGHTAAEAVGNHIELIIPLELRDEERLILERLRMGERIDHFETVRIAKDGRRVNISLSVSPIKDREGRIVGASKVARDITAQKHAQAERESLLASERSARRDAERAGRMKDEFLATLSHELRTPLNAILGWVRILRKDRPPDETLREALAVIDRNAHMQAQLVADLLDMSRITSGKLRLDVQRLELAAIIDAAVESVRAAATAKGIEIKCVLEPLEGPLSGDPSRLQQALWNLLSNAVKFTPRGGTLRIAMAQVESHVEIAIGDTGAGIRPDFLPHVFERFRQADSSAARTHGGLGLGLSIVKQLIELHGGTVRAASRGEGQGSTFTISLPITAVAPSQSEAESPRSDPMADAPENGGPPTISGVFVLVVEDDADARDLIRRVLEECAAKVVLAQSAAEALAVLEKASPDVILSDIGLPGQDGYSFMRTVRKSGLKIPAIALTAFARSADRTRALSAGFQAHIAKPAEPTELIATVAALVDAIGGPRAR